MAITLCTGITCIPLSMSRLRTYHSRDIVVLLEGGTPERHTKALSRHLPTGSVVTSSQQKYPNSQRNAQADNAE